jgi:tetratricopeptide (TPR) repeat protein
VAAAALLALLVAAVYLPALRNGFVDYDDNVYVTDHPLVARGLSASGALAAFATIHGGNWHPLTWISHQLDVTLYGLRPAGHHLTSVLLHAANAVLLFRLLLGLTGAPAPALLAAALFAVHPLNVESVAWVAERKNLLSTLFLLLAARAWLATVRRPRRAGQAAAVALYAASLLAKPMGVTLPFLLLLLDAWPLGRFRGETAAARRAAARRLLREKAPFLLLAAASCVVTWVAQGRGGMFYAVPWPWRAGNALVAYARYLGMAARPAHLAAFYPHPGGTLAGGAILGAAALLLAATAGALLALRRLPWIAAGWFWYLGALVPVIGLVQVGDQALADRYAYLPLVGVFLALAWGIAAAAARWRRAGVALGTAAALAVVALIPVARRQVAVWKDSASLFGHAVEVTGGSAIAYNGLGVVAGQARRYAEAAELFRKAVRLQPAFTIGWSNLGNALTGLRDPEAERAYETAIRLKPDSPSFHFNLGMYYLGIGDVARADAVRGRLAQLDPAKAAEFARYVDAVRAVHPVPPRGAGAR